MTLSYPETEPLTNKIIGCAIEVHRHLGPGLLESIYEECFCSELYEASLTLERQRPIAVIYKGRPVGAYFKPDLLVGGSVIVEIKSVEKLLPVHEAQVLTYLKITGIHVGLLFNFNTAILASGMKRLSH